MRAPSSSRFRIPQANQNVHFRMPWNGRPGRSSLRQVPLSAETADSIIIYFPRCPDGWDCSWKVQALDSVMNVAMCVGSPFDQVEHQGRSFYPAQANNAYVFPAIGHAAVICQATNIPSEAFLVAAEVLSSLSPEKDIEEGHLFPPFSSIITASERLMISLCYFFEEQGLAKRPVGYTWEEMVSQSLWTPDAHVVYQRSRL